jgi:hypothetical protein
MKNLQKTLFLFALAFSSSLLSAQQGPVYLNNFLLGPYICEFAANGPRQELIAEIQPYVQNGRVYFLCWGFPISSGSLRPGFEFNLDREEQFFNNPRIKAVYRGTQNDICNIELCFVAGYAERGMIIITQVFFDDKVYEEWVKSVRFFE